MAEATRIRGMFEASRFASSVVNTTHHWPCTSVFMPSTRHAPDGQTLLKAGTIHLAQCVSVLSFALHVSLSNF